MILDSLLEFESAWVEEPRILFGPVEDSKD